MGDWGRGRRERSAGRAAGSRRCGAHGSEDRGAGAGAAPRQEGERGPCPGAGGGRPAGGAWSGAEPGAVLAWQALGARGRGNPVIPRGRRVPSGSWLPFEPRGILSPIPEPQCGPQTLYLSPSGDLRSPLLSPGGALSPLPQLPVPPQPQCRHMISSLNVQGDPHSLCLNSSRFLASLLWTLLFLSVNVGGSYCLSETGREFPPPP